MNPYSWTGIVDLSKCCSPVLLVLIHMLNRLNYSTPHVLQVNLTKPHLMAKKDNSAIAA